MTARHLHRIGAFCLAAFITLHLANHALILIGPEAHQTVQNLARAVYRAPFVEPVLIALIAAQIVTGIRRLAKKGWPRLRWAWVQTLSGAYLAFFLIQHMGAVFATRAFYPDIDTNAYWAAAVVSQTPHVIYFAPYYMLGIVALFAHVASALRGTKLAPFAIWIGWAGLPVAGLVVTGFAGLFHEITLPQPYQVYLDNYWGLAPSR